MRAEAGKLNRVVIAGGGTAGWIAAAALSKKLGELLDITLVESDAIGTVGVGESTIPPMRVFNKLLGIDEQEFMRATQATFKLGISFENWRSPGHEYIHSFGSNGKNAWLAEFHHFWLHSLSRGFESEIGDFCYELKAAREQKFATGPDSNINYAYHLDATRYARFLRSYSEKLGVKRVEGKIVEVNQHADSGFIESIRLDDGQLLEGDIFIDCTGFRGLLIEQTLKTGYEDWTHWLPCDSAAVVQTSCTEPPVPYTRAIAHDAGWRWRIPLQTRMGNGFVYCSQYMSDDEAKSQLLNSIDGEPLTEPRVLKFRAGRRIKQWNKNCVSIGLASGFLEPLESTSIHLIVLGVTRLMQYFPFGGVSDSFVDHYNTLAREELEKIRDFLVLHYHVTERDDTDFWRYCRTMAVPDSLSKRLSMFAEEAYVYQADSDLFRVDSWVQVMLGQGILPKDYHPLARLMKDAELRQFLGSLRASVDQAVSRLPSHQEFIKQYCKAPEM